MSRRIFLIHGYSDAGPSFNKWKDILTQRGFVAETINVCDYKTLSNEITIKDIAEGFDRALRHQDLHEEEFDAIVHSTGMLVLRSWLCTYSASRIKKLKHLIGLAPASYGSPLAYMGRSWMGAIFKGNRQAGPDFMEAGDKVLDGLELGSAYTWRLAHQDLLNENQIFYCPEPHSPYVFTFIGTERYGWIKDLVAKAPGTDGTVRWAGCSLNTRKIEIDFTRPEQDPKRFNITKWREDKRSNLGLPFVPIQGLNHASILQDPSEELIDLVVEALQVNDKDALTQWNAKAIARTAPVYEAMPKYQQFIVHCKDERNDPIPDFHLQIYKYTADDPEGELVNMDMHPYSADHSYRCYHVNLDELDYKNLASLRLELTASSGSDLVGYSDYRAPLVDPSPSISLNLSRFLKDEQVRFFYPFTTTLLEITLNREPLPMWRENKIVRFMS